MSNGAAEAIEAANASFMEAFGAGDSAGIAALYTDNGQLLPPNSDVVLGHEDIAAFWQALIDMGIAGAELATAELDELGDTAIEIGRYTLQDAEGGALDHGKFIVVWKNDGGTWKLHQDIWNSSQPAE